MSAMCTEKAALILNAYQYTAQLYKVLVLFNVSHGDKISINDILACMP